VSARAPWTLATVLRMHRWFNEKFVLIEMNRLIFLRKTY